MSNVIENGIDSLRFFLGNGNEIQMKKQFSARWEIIPDDRVYTKHPIECQQLILKQ